MPTLRGRVTSVKWRDEITCQTNARLAPEGPNPKRLSYAFRGTFANPLFQGEVLSITGEWVKSGDEETLMVKQFERLPPSTREGTLGFLKGYIQGMQTKQAEALLDAAGGTLEGVVALCTKKPQELDKLFPKTRKLRARLRAARWDRSEMDFDMMTALKAAKLHDSQIQSLVKFFGAGALRAMAQTSPYDFCQVPKIGFTSAEKVARYYAEQQGRTVDLYNPDRLVYGVCEVVSRERQSGHVCVDEATIIRSGLWFLGLPRTAESKAKLKDALGQALIRRLLVKDYESIYTRGLYKAECDLAISLNKLIIGGARSLFKSAAQITKELKAHPQYKTLSDEQMAAICTLAAAPVSGLLGGPGRGKTHTLSAFVYLLEQHRRTYLLLAPTGKAAKRASEMTGKLCQTIHKACGLEREEDVHAKRYGGKIAKRERFNVDVIIVDESSMVDLPLAFELVRRIRAGRTALIWVGDPDQLEPVGPGQPFKDMIASKAIPMAMLTQVFRQKAGSAIISGADAINRGEMPEFPPPRSGKANDKKAYEVRLFDPSTAPGHPGFHDQKAAIAFESDIATRWTLSLIERYRVDLGISPVRDVQVYAPQREGMLGLKALNFVLQSRLNPATNTNNSAGIRIEYNFAPRIGDKVMQISNNYRMRLTTAPASVREFGKSGGRVPDDGAILKDLVSVMNGQVGYVSRVDAAAGELWVNYDEWADPVLYLRSDEWRKLTPAYAMSIHKSQGSETPYAIILLPEDANPRLLTESMLYTAWTRAKEGLGVIAREATVARAAGTPSPFRGTRLAQRLERNGGQGKKPIKMFTPPVRAPLPEQTTLPLQS